MENSKINQTSNIITRRDFFKISSLAIATSLIIPDSLQAKVDILSLFDVKNETRKLNILNINTRKQLNIEYFENGKYIDEALLEIYRHMGDKRSGEIAKIDKQLLNTLYKIQTRVNSSKPLELISGYRSEDTNKHLARVDHSVSKDSFHTQGKAADINIKGLSTAELHHIALDLNAGGVGYYPKSNFVHVDVGPVRNWRG